MVHHDQNPNCLKDQDYIGSFWSDLDHEIGSSSSLYSFVRLSNSKVGKMRTGVFVCCIIFLIFLNVFTLPILCIARYSWELAFVWYVLPFFISWIMEFVYWDWIYNLVKYRQNYQDLFVMAFFPSCQVDIVINRYNYTNWSWLVFSKLAILGGFPAYTIVRLTVENFQYCGKSSEEGVVPAVEGAVAVNNPLHNMGIEVINVNDNNALGRTNVKMNFYNRLGDNNNEDTFNPINADQAIPAGLD